MKGHKENECPNALIKCKDCLHIMTRRNYQTYHLSDKKAECLLYQIENLKNLMNESDKQRVKDYEKIKNLEKYVSELEAKNHALLDENKNLKKLK